MNNSSKNFIAKHEFIYMQKIILFVFIASFYVFLTASFNSHFIDSRFFEIHAYLCMCVGLLYFLSRILDAFCSKAKNLIFFQVLFFIFLFLHILFYLGYIIYFLFSLTLCFMFITFSTLIIYSVVLVALHEKSNYLKSLIKNSIIINSIYFFHSFHPMSKNQYKLYSLSLKVYIYSISLLSIIGAGVTLFLFKKEGIDFTAWGQNFQLVDLLVVFGLYMFFLPAYKGTLFSICDLMAVLEQEKIIGQPVMVKALKKESKNNVS